MVQSASYGARRYGIHPGMPIAQAVRLCPAATFVQGAFAHYRDASRAVRLVLQRFSLEAILSLLTARLEGQLREEQLVGRTVSLKLRHDDFRTVTRRRTLEIATDLDAELYQAARGLFREATNLGLSAEADLFEPPERQRLRDLSVAVDKVREKYGFGAVTAGSVLRARRGRKRSG